jgi:iron-sulfur cluster repair protein YtfE (RIC family)
VTHDDFAGRWEHAPIGDLIDYIVRAYHRPLPAAIARIAAGARGAARVAIERLRELVVEHLREEEELVFPWLRSPQSRTAGVLVHLLERDHREIEGALDALDAGDAEIAELARTLRELFRLEGSILFPRALAGA